MVPTVLADSAAVLTMSKSVSPLALSVKQYIYMSSEIGIMQYIDKCLFVHSHV